MPERTKRLVLNYLFPQREPEEEIELGLPYEETTSPPHYLTSQEFYGPPNQPPKGVSSEVSSGDVLPSASELPDRPFPKRTLPPGYTWWWGPKAVRGIQGYDWVPLKYEKQVRVNAIGNKETFHEVMEEDGSVREVIDDIEGQRTLPLQEGQLETNTDKEGKVWRWDERTGQYSLLVGYDSSRDKSVKADERRAHEQAVANELDRKKQALAERKFEAELGLATEAAQQAESERYEAQQAAWRKGEREANKLDWERTQDTLAQAQAAFQAQQGRDLTARLEQERLADVRTGKYNTLAYILSQMAGEGEENVSPLLQRPGGLQETLRRMLATGATFPKEIAQSAGVESPYFDTAQGRIVPGTSLYETMIKAGQKPTSPGSIGGLSQVVVPNYWEWQRMLPSQQATYESDLAALGIPQGDIGASIERSYQSQQGTVVNPEIGKFWAEKARREEMERKERELAFGLAGAKRHRPFFQR